MKIGYFGLVIRNGKILLVRPSKDGGFWALPGGGRKKGESQAKTCAREVKEETNLDCKVGDLLGEFLRTDMAAKLVVFSVAKSSGKVKPDGKEINACRWYSLEDLWKKRKDIKPYHFASIYKALASKKRKKVLPLKVKLNGQPSRKQWRKLLL